MARYSRIRSPTYPPSSTSKPTLRDFLKNSQSKLFERTPLWFYILAEAEKAGGNRLGEVGSFLVASTFVGVLLADPDSALSRGFDPGQSPLRMARQQPDRLDCKMDALCKRDGIELPVPLRIMHPFSSTGLAVTTAGFFFTQCRGRSLSVIAIGQPGSRATAGLAGRTASLGNTLC